jgi:ribonuclease VapC
MVIDTSAVIAIFLGEPEAERFDEAIAAAKTRLLPATCLFEARIVLVARRVERSVNDLDLWLLKAGVDVVPVDGDLVDFAIQAWLVHGKGRHPAGLNFADCLSYALAKRSGEPLLFKGEDFSKTDLRGVFP